MDKKIVIGVGAAIVIVGGIFVKNNIAEGKFEEAVKSKVASNPVVKSIEGDYYCGGFIGTQCGIDDAKITLQEGSKDEIKLTAQSIEIDNIVAANKFEAIESAEPIDVLKGLMKINDNYTFTVKGLKGSLNQSEAEFIKTVKDEAQKELSKTDYKFFEKLTNLYTSDGVDITSYISADDEGVVSLNGDIKGLGLSIGFETNIDFKEDDIAKSNKYNIENSLMHTKIDNFSINIKTHDYSVPELAAFITKLPYQGNRYKQRSFERDLRSMGINTKFGDFAGEDIKKFFESDKAKNIIGKFTSEVQNGIGLFIKDEKNKKYILDVLKDTTQKISDLGSGKDESLKITLSTNDKTIQDLINGVQNAGKLELGETLNVSVN